MKSALFVYPYKNLGTNPTVYALLVLLSKSGYSVDVIWPEKESVAQPFCNSIPNVQLHCGLLNDISPSRVTGIRSFIRHVRTRSSESFRDNVRIHQLARRKRYSFILGTDPSGLVIAKQLSDSTGSPLVYLSFELLFRDETNNECERVLKEKELAAITACKLVILQDEYRQELFCRENNFPLSKTARLPVAPLDSRPNRGRVIHEMFSLPSDVYTLLFQGTIAPWSGRDEWRYIAEMLPEKFRLIVHSRNILDQRTRKFLSYLNHRGRFVFSDKLIPIESLPDFTASADAGLVSYSPSPDSWYDLGNIRSVGLASGKFAYFMMCGVPVITNSFSNLSTIVHSAQVGRVYSSLGEFPSELERLIENRQIYSKNSRSYYESTLDPEVYFGALLDQLDRM